MWGIELLVMLAMIAVNSVFAAYEIALASVTEARLERLVKEKRRGARVSLKMKQGIEASLAAVQLGITLAAAIAAAVGGAGAGERIAPYLVESLGVSPGVSEALAIAMVVLPLTVITILAGELIPKVFALRNAEFVVLTLSRPMRGFSLAVYPGVWMFETIVRLTMSWGEKQFAADGNGESRSDAAKLQELRTTAALARSSRLIGFREESIILGATDMQSRPVREIMLAAEDIRTLAADASLADNLIAAHLDMHTRFPVVEQAGDPQTITGYVNVKDIIATLHLNPQDSSMRGIIRPLLSLPAEQSIADCLEQMMRQHAHIALVRGGGGEVLGMVTLEDILEELVGEIEDEFDRLPAHLVSSGKSWVAGGGVALAQLKTATGLELSSEPPPGHADDPIRTLNQWIQARAEQPVSGGLVLEGDHTRVLVRKVRRGNVQEAHLTPLAKVAEEAR